MWKAEDQEAEVVIQPNPEGHIVEMWSTNRLPFEPKGALLEAKRYLHGRLQELVADSGKILEACYISEDNSFVDVENVLFYNVGTGCFSNSTRSGLSFARKNDLPPATADGRSHWRHYHRYSITESASANQSGSLVSANLEFEISKINTSLKPHRYWWFAKQGNLIRSENFNCIQEPFEIRVNINGPRLSAGLASYMKSLLDGIISALHFDPSMISHDEACSWIAEDLNLGNSHVAHFLVDESWGILGPRNVVRKSAKAVAWNPADEFCHRGRIFFDSRPMENWSIQAQFIPLAK